MTQAYCNARGLSPNNSLLTTAKNLGDIVKPKGDLYSV